MHVAVGSICPRSKCSDKKGDSVLVGTNNHLMQLILLVALHNDYLLHLFVSHHYRVMSEADPGFKVASCVTVSSEPVITNLELDPRARTTSAS